MPIPRNLLNIPKRDLDDWDRRIPVRRHVEVAHVDIQFDCCVISSHNVAGYQIPKHRERSFDEVIQVVQSMGATDVIVQGHNQWEVSTLIERLDSEGLNVTTAEALREVRAIIRTPVVTPKERLEDGKPRDAIEWLLMPDI